MRKKLIVAITALAVLAFAGIALAKQVQTADIKFTKSKAGGPTAIASTFKVFDKANTTPGQVGKPTRQIKEVDINFPAGMKFNYKAAPVCTQVAGVAITAKCKKAHLATGSTKIDARGPQLPGFLKATLDAYNEKRAGQPSGLAIVLHSSSPLVNNQVLFPTLTGTKLKTVLPIGALKLIKGYLTDFHLVIPIKSGKVKGKKAYYATLPKKCPKGGKFIVKTKYFYDGGGSFTTPGTKNKCKK